MDLQQDLTSDDILIQNGNVSFVRGIDAIKQHLTIRLRTFAGEWFLNTKIGIPYFTDVFKKSPDLTVLNSVFTKAILDTPGIISLNALSFDLINTRQLSITLSATTSAGVLDYSGFIGV